jgi:hypothetical protein
MDYFEQLIEEMILKHLKGQTWGTSGIIHAYNPDNHTARVILQPSGELTPDLPILSSHTGYADPIAPGTPCYVNLERGDPVSVQGVHHNDATQVPAASLVLGGDAVIHENLTVYGTIQIGRVSALPTPTVDMRGQVLLLTSSPPTQAGVADGLYICLQKADGTLAWTLIVSG